jgi:predicted DsbA family dithiol-disulfide isomerase
VAQKVAAGVTVIAPIVAAYGGDVRVEVWSDVVCPWCYIGKRKFEAALAQYTGDQTFEVVWRPFQLDPTAPKGVAQPLKEAYEKKFGGPERAAEIIEHVSSVASSVGLSFDMDHAVRANTMDAHRLIGYALSTHGPDVQSEVKERLMRAYFTEGRNIGDLATLAALAAEVCLDHDEVARFLASNDGMTELAAELEQAMDLGVTGVPHFVFDGRWAIPGAQDPELFLRAFQRMADLLADEADMPEGDAEACRVDARPRS